MSFIINQNFDLKSPQFNFARDYYKDLDTLKKESLDNFPNHFITNVGGVLYQLDKSSTSGSEWRRLATTVDDWYDIAKVALKTSKITNSVLLLTGNKGPVTSIDIPSADTTKPGFMTVSQVNSLADATITAHNAKDELKSLTYTHNTTKKQVETNTSDITALKGQVSNISYSLSKADNKGSIDIKLSKGSTIQNTVNIPLANYNTFSDNGSSGLMSVEDKKKLDKIALGCLSKAGVGLILTINGDDEVSIPFVKSGMENENYGLMMGSDKAKLDSIAEGANKTVVDTIFSTTSTNPVENRVIKTELDRFSTAVEQSLNNKASKDVATTTANGLLSSTDKNKLNNLAADASSTYATKTDVSNTYLAKSEISSLTNEDIDALWNAAKA